MNISKNNCYGFDTGYSMSEPGYNSDEELEKIKVRLSQ
jgi:hypothetical protein